MKRRHWYVHRQQVGRTACLNALTRLLPPSPACARVDNTIISSALLDEIAPSSREGLCGDVMGELGRWLRCSGHKHATRWRAGFDGFRAPAPSCKTWLAYAVSTKAHHHRHAVTERRASGPLPADADALPHHCASPSPRPQYGHRLLAKIRWGITTPAAAPAT